MANTVKVNISASDEGFKQTMQQAAGSVTKLGQSMVTSSGKMKTINGALRDAKREAAELTRQWRALDDTTKNSDFGRSLQRQLQDVLNTAGQLQDIKADVANEIKHLASDTAVWDATKQGIGLVTSGMQSLTGVVGLCGGDVKAFTKALTMMNTVQSLANTAISIGNALQKDSALNTALRTLRTKLFTTAEETSTVAINANTAAETVNNAATAAGTAKQNAWNVAKAVAKALLGDFTGLLLVGVGVVAAYALATGDSTDELDKQSESFKDNNGYVDTNTILKERLKKAEEDWSKSVTQAASSQIQKYTELQLKWQQCNTDQKKREQFQREYGEEVNRVAGKVKKLSEYEDFFVKNTHDVVEAILARAAAEASAQKYAEAILKRAENDRNGTVANGRYYHVKHEGDWVYTTELDEYNIPLTEAQRKQRSGEARQSGETNVNNSSYIQITKSQAEALTKEYKKQADAIKAADDAEVEYWHNFAVNANKNAANKAQAAGMSTEKYNPPKGFSGGGSHGGSHGGSGNSGSTEVQPVAQSLEWLRKQLQQLQHDLSYGLIPADKIDETKAKIDYLKKDIEKKEIELGFKDTPIIGSLEELEQRLNKLKTDLQKGLIPDSDIDKTNKQIEDLTFKLEDKKIELGLELEPEFDYDRLLREKKRAYKTVNGVTGDSIQVTADVSKLNEVMKQLRNIPQWYDDEISRLSTQLSEDNLTIEERIKIITRRDELQRQSDEIVNGKLTIPAEIEPTYITQGSDWDMRKSYDNQAAQIQRVADDYTKGIIKTSDEAKQKIAELNAQLIQLGMKPIKIEIKTEAQKTLEGIQNGMEGFNNVVVSTVDSFDQLIQSIDEGASAWEIFKNVLSTVEQLLTSIGTIIQVVTSITDANTAAKQANTAASVANAVAETTETGAAIGKAGANAAEAGTEAGKQMSKMGPFGWIAGIAAAIAVAGVLFGLVSKGKGFADGGIIRGSTTMGDKIPIMANANEMILNTRQQARLFDMIDHGNIGGVNGTTVTSVRVQGSDIILALRNYSKINHNKQLTNILK